ncbi:imidazolonepropionase [Aeromicrobium choanae]|uniref:Imidazolonepropionase n=1 Tax=Aeromicrobium choanae TaxID=1736691 RepID=A0A1T4Z2Z8_9ACTN|nr:imidazolonepropionase [Aeromicrobium choanae]SKB08419.1 imidazolonepropionase [Aeromicrobium choanae]
MALTNIGELVTWDDERPILHDASIVIVDGEVAWTGEGPPPAADQHFDLGGAAVVPGFVDSHSHVVFDGDRSGEFEARMSGVPYGAGGIRSTVEATRAASVEDLRRTARHLVGEARRQGTTTIEIKSGYGLDVATEGRLVEVAAELTDEVTFLGAHVVPADARTVDDYVALVTGEMLDACAPHSRWIDVFVEEGAFGEEAALEVLSAGMGRGLLPRVHANQLGPGPGARVAAAVGAAAADHCTFLSDEDVRDLVDAGVVIGLLPGVEFSTRQPFPDARRLLDAGATVALATDCNPGSSFTTSMPFCIAVAVRDMHLTPLEALWSATLGGAASLRRTDVGHLRVGAHADLVVLDAPSHLHLAYRPGVPLVSRVLTAEGHDEGARGAGG